MIKNLIFDMGGVLIPLNRHRCISAFRNLVGFTDFEKVLSNFVQSGFFQDFEAGTIDSAGFRENVRRGSVPMDMEVRDADIDYCLNCFLDDIPQSKFQALDFFKGKYRLYLLSNTNPIGFGRCREQFLANGRSVDEVFEHLYLSYRMKCCKPDEKIFRDMLAHGGFNPAECLFIDDAPANVETAERLGLKALHYNTSTSLKDAVCARILELDGRLPSSANDKEELQ